MLTDRHKPLPEVAALVEARLAAQGMTVDWYRPELDQRWHFADRTEIPELRADLPESCFWWRCHDCGARWLWEEPVWSCPDHELRCPDCGGLVVANPLSATGGAGGYNG